MADFRATTITDLAVIVTEHLQNQGIEVVVVGGLAVEIYTENLYLTNDIDLVNINYSAPKQLHSAMAELGFYKQGRVYVNKSTDITVEFPSGPLPVGDELINETTRKKVGNKSIPVLEVEDVVKDRLAAFIHWRDRQSLVQATAILLKHRLAPANFKSFCEREGTVAEYGKALQADERQTNQQYGWPGSHINSTTDRRNVDRLSLTSANPNTRD